MASDWLTHFLLHCNCKVDFFLRNLTWSKESRFFTKLDLSAKMVALTFDWLTHFWLLLCKTAEWIFMKLYREKVLNVYQTEFVALRSINDYGKPWITLNDERIIQYHWQSILQRQLSIPLKPVHVQTPVAWSVDRHITVLCAPEAHSTRIQWHLNHRCMGSRFFSIIAWKL